MKSGWLLTDSITNEDSIINHLIFSIFFALVLEKDILQQDWEFRKNDQEINDMVVSSHLDMLILRCLWGIQQGGSPIHFGA